MTPRKTEAYLNANAQFATPSGISQRFWTAVHEPILYITCVRFMTSPKGNSLSKPEKEAFAYFLCHYNITEAAVLGEELQKVASNLLEHGTWQQCVSAILIYAMILTLAIILDLAIILRPVITNTPISLGLLPFVQMHFSPSSHLSIGMEQVRCHQYRFISSSVHPHGSIQ